MVTPSMATNEAHVTNISLDIESSAIPAETLDISSDLQHQSYPVSKTSTSI